MSNCPADSQIGTARILGERTIVPVYNMVAPPGVPAQFGFSFANVSIYVELRTCGPAISASIW